MIELLQGTGLSLEEFLSLKRVQPMKEQLFYSDLQPVGLPSGPKRGACRSPTDHLLKAEIPVKKGILATMGTAELAGVYLFGAMGADHDQVRLERGRPRPHYIKSALFAERTGTSALCVLFIALHR